MQTITLKEAEENYPDMVTVLRVFKPILKGNTGKLIALKDVVGISTVYVDTELSSRSLIDHFCECVPERIQDAEIGTSLILPMSPVVQAYDEADLIDVTKAAQEVWNGNN